MKGMLTLLIILFVSLQYTLWIANGGIRDTIHLKKAVATLSQTSKQLSERNRLLAAEVNDLKQGLTAIEEHARNDLGMIKQDETFYHIID